jgi:DNA-binding transcriptional regulator/RsmH inhibitor MraZ
MDFPVHDKVIREGFCWGHYESTVDRGPRIRLNMAILKLLGKHKVKELWCYPGLQGPLLILCPPRYRLDYIKMISESLHDEQALRLFVSPGQPIPLKQHGKVPLLAGCLGTRRIIEGHQVRLIGVGFWFEVWAQEDWLNAVDGDNDQ